MVAREGFSKGERTCSAVAAEEPTHISESELLLQGKKTEL